MKTSKHIWWISLVMTLVLSGCETEERLSCTPDDCSGRGNCEVSGTTIVCHCYTGYTGERCQTALPTCAAADLDCGDHGLCQDSSGTAACQCDLGYAGYECESCAAGFNLEGDECVPASAWCGNGRVEGYEECEPLDDGACPGKCSAQCACPSVAPRDRLEIHVIDPGQIDVYKVHHHGSNDSSSDSLLDQMSAKLALIPVGTDNPYGHPGQYTTQRLDEHDVDVHRTDLDGSLEVHCDGASCSLQDQVSQ